MAILANVSKGLKKEKPITIIYGAGGLGKDTFAAGFPSPFVVDVSKGTGKLDVSRYEPETYEETLAKLEEFRDEKHDFKTLNVSELDVLEKKLWAKIISEDAKGAKNMVQAAGGYGNGFKVAIEYWVQLQTLLKQIQAKGYYINLVCHELVYSYNDPTAAAYDRYRMNLHEGSKESAAKLWFDFADIVLFAKKKVYQKDDNRAIDEGKHYIYTQGRAAFDAKSRYPLPFEMELNAPKFLAALERGPLTAEELEKECLKLASAIKDALLKGKVEEKISKNKGNAAELGVILENIKVILTKE